MSVTTFRDSIDPREIPTSDIVGGYGDGRWIWSPSWYDGTNGWDLHPQARALVFVVSPDHLGDALDVERGDATPADVPAWVSSWDRFDRGWRIAMVYCDRETWPLVVLELEAAGIDPAGLQVDWLISTLDGTTMVTPPPGAKPPVAVQARGSALTGGAYDEWAVFDLDWAAGRWPPPAPAPPSPPPQIGEKAPMSASPPAPLAPGTSWYAAGFYQGQPGAYFDRDVFVAVAADSSLAPKGAAAVVYFVPRDWDGQSAQADQHNLTIPPSQEVTVKCGIAGEVSVRVEVPQDSPGAVSAARAYEEFRPN